MEHKGNLQKCLQKDIYFCHYIKKKFKLLKFVSFKIDIGSIKARHLFNSRIITE